MAIAIRKLVRKLAADCEKVIAGELALPAGMEIWKPAKVTWFEQYNLPINQVNLGRELEVSDEWVRLVLKRLRDLKIFTLEGHAQHGSVFSVGYRVKEEIFCPILLSLTALSDLQIWHTSDISKQLSEDLSGVSIQIALINRLHELYDKIRTESRSQFFGVNIRDYQYVTETPVGPIKQWYSALLLNLQAKLEKISAHEDPAYWAPVQVPILPDLVRVPINSQKSMETNDLTPKNWDLKYPIILKDIINLLSKVQNRINLLDNGSAELGPAELGPDPGQKSNVVAFSKRFHSHRPKEDDPLQMLLNTVIDVKKMIWSPYAVKNYEKLDRPYLVKAMEYVQHCCKSLRVDAKELLMLVFNYYNWKHKGSLFPIKYLGTEDFKNRIWIMARALAEVPGWKAEHSGEVLLEWFDKWILLCRTSALRILKVDPYTEYSRFKPYFEWCFLQAYETWRDFRPRFEYETGLEMPKIFYITGVFKRMKNYNSNDFEATFGDKGRQAAREYVRDYEAYAKISEERKLKLEELHASGEI
jgi:hypothetical protein